VVLKQISISCALALILFSYVDTVEAKIVDKIECPMGLVMPESVPLNERTGVK
jgi:hypothetical protein